MSEEKTIIDHISEKPVKVIWRHAAQLIAGLVLTWSALGIVAKPVVKSWAGDTFNELLLEDDSFKKMQEQTDTTSTDVKAIKDETKELTDELKALKTQSIIDGQTLKSVDEKLKLITDAIIKKQFGLTTSPPGTGPSGLPNFNGEIP